MMLAQMSWLLALVLLPAPQAEGEPAAAMQVLSVEDWVAAHPDGPAAVQTIKHWLADRTRPAPTPRTARSQTAGIGVRYDSRWGSGRIRCSVCNGKGRVWQPAILSGEAKGGRYKVPVKGYMTCPNCNGAGWFTCSICGGDGKINEALRYPSYAERCPKCR